ncbi:MAG: PorV/PorQ family protein [Candidatus Latescibacteria bacterium]|nr:PorV/PorQ family protein [Candidatus Latescibacterota bacterium]
MSRFSFHAGARFLAPRIAGLLLALWVSLPAGVQATPESRAAVLFLLIEPGARAIGMGESYVAIADDATASYFNPAALAGQQRRQFNFTHSKWLPGLADDLSYEFLAYATPVEGWGNLGFNIALLNLGEQIRTDERGTNQGTFRSYDVALSGAYGAQVSDKLKAGIGLKFIRSNLADQGAGIERGKGVGNSFAADVGLLWQPSALFSVGAALRNMGPRITYIDASQADPLPQHIVVGAAYQVLDSEYNDVLVSMDIYKPLIADGSFASNLVKAWSDEALSDEFKEMDLHVGVEYKYGLSANADEAFFAGRAGYSLDSDGELKTPTFGVGLKYNLFQIDIAYITGEDTPMQDNTRFSLNISF